MDSNSLRTKIFIGIAAFILILLIVATVFFMQFTQENVEKVTGFQGSNAGAIKFNFDKLKLIGISTQ